MLGDITTMGAKVYGCSPDSLASHDNFIETEQLGFPLISDESGAVMEAFSAWKEVSFPHTLLSAFSSARGGPFARVCIGTVGVVD